MEEMFNVPLGIRLGFVASVLIGVLLSAPLLVYSRSLGVRRFRWIWGLALIAAALVYVGFAAAWGDGGAVLLESVGLAAFTAIAVLGLVQRSELIAVGWVLHVAWDLFLHPSPLQVAGYAPWWYPPLCVGFDLFVAGYLLAVFTRVRREAGAVNEEEPPPLTDDTVHGTRGRTRR